MTANSDYAIRRFADPAGFLARTEGWLLENEAEHNLLIGITHQLMTGSALFQQPIYLATVEAAGAVVGCAFRTPPYKLGVTRIPLGAIEAVVADVAEVYDSLPAVMGDEATAHAFAEQWAARVQCGVEPGMRHRIYQLTTVKPPPRPAVGEPRLATQRDAKLVTRWIEAFSAEAGLYSENAHGLAAARIKQKSLYLWMNRSEPVTMAAWSGETPNGRRVGYVYTPPEHRRHGYATSLVAHVSRQILADGLKFCFLYTDLSNPISNSIYQQIGYEPVCDVMDWNFTEANANPETT